MDVFFGAKLTFSESVDPATALRQSLGSTPRYIPSWYLYDREGSELFEEILSDNTYYYFKTAEMEVFQRHVEEVVSKLGRDCTLIELGSGSSRKTRLLIDVLLKHQPKLKYVPIDICEDMLEKACNLLSKDYNDKLDIQMLAVDYDKGLSYLRNIKEGKIILWLGGFQNQSFEKQIKRMRMMAETMTGQDVVLLTVDITQNAKQVENAYLDASGTAERLYRNAFKRLNTEFGSTIQDDDIEIDSKFIEDIQGTIPGRVLIRARSTRDQTHPIPGLGMTLTLQKGDYVNLYEGEGYSFKYTQQQLEHIATSSGLVMKQIWKDSNNHVALCCLTLNNEK